MADEDAARLPDDLLSEEFEPPDEPLDPGPG